MTNKAHITIGRTSSNIGGDKMSIQITDRSSGVMIYRGTMELDDFVRALTGLAHVSIDSQFIPTEETAKQYGKEKEMKTVHLYFNSYSKDKEKLYELIEPELKDGWTLWSDGLGTQQNSAKGHAISLCRYVDKN